MNGSGSVRWSDYLGKRAGYVLKNLGVQVDIYPNRGLTPEEDTACLVYVDRGITFWFHRRPVAMIVFTQKCKEEICGIKIGMNQDEVKSKLGEPNEVHRVSDTGAPPPIEYDWVYQDTENYEFLLDVCFDRGQRVVQITMSY